LGKKPFFFHPLESEQREGGGGAGAAGRCQSPANRATAGTGGGENDEGLMGDRFPYLPWLLVTRGGGSTGGGGLEAASLGDGGVPASRGGKLGLWRCEVR
jgi:hypothetical protein